MLHEYLGLGLLLEHEQHAVLNDFGQVASVFFSLIHQLLNNVLDQSTRKDHREDCFVLAELKKLFNNETFASWILEFILRFACNYCKLFKAFPDLLLLLLRVMHRWDEFYKFEENVLRYLPLVLKMESDIR